MWTDWDTFFQGSFFASFALGWVITNGAGLASYLIDTIRRRMMMTSGEEVKYFFVTLLVLVWFLVMTNSSSSSLVRSMDLEVLNYDVISQLHEWWWTNPSQICINSWNMMKLNHLKKFWFNTHYYKTKKKWKGKMNNNRNFIKQLVGTGRCSLTYQMEKRRYRQNWHS